MIKTRLETARDRFVNLCSELFSDGESLEYDHIFEMYDAYVNQFLQDLYVSEEETAKMIERGGWMDDYNFFKKIFDHFKTERIYNAIKSNCENAFMLEGEFAESPDMITFRKDLISYMQKQLNIN